MEKPSTATPTAQPSSVPRCIRQANPAGLSSRGAPLAGPRRGGDQPGAQVASLGEGVRQRHPGEQQRDGQGEDPPAFAVEGAYLVAPAERGDPGRPGALHAGAVGALRRRGRRRRRAARRASPTVAAASALAPREVTESWAVTAAIAVKATPTPPIAAAAAMEPASGRPAPTRATASSTAASDVRRDDDEQRGGERRVPADHVGAEQFRPAGLLVLAGVPCHREGAQQRDDQGQRHVRLGDHHRADLGAADGAVEGAGTRLDAEVVA